MDIEQPEDLREQFPECLTVGALRARLAEYSDDDIVNILVKTSEDVEDIHDLADVQKLDGHGPLLIMGDH